MIFEGVVEYVDNKRNIVKVRVPQLHGTKNGTIYVPTERINNAYISSTPGVKYTLKVGDVVTIGYYNWDASRPVILGIVTVPREKNNFTDETTRDLTIASDSLLVKSDATLPQKTTIGEITYNEIKHLKGIKENISDAIARVESDVSDAYGLASETAQNLQQNYYTGTVVDSKIKSASDELSKVIDNANDSSTESFLNNFIQSFNWYQSHLCDWAKGIGLSQYNSFIAPLNEKGVISGADININGVPLHLAGSEPFGEALVRTLNLWVDNPAKFVDEYGCESDAHAKVLEKYRYSVGGGSMSDAWCAMAVSALFAYQSDGIAKGIRNSFTPGHNKAQFYSSMSVTQLAWSGKKSKREVGFPAVLRRGTEDELIIPIDQFKPGGKYFINNKPDIRLGDIGISKHYKEDGPATEDNVRSHTFYITSIPTNVKGKGWYVSAIGGNNSTISSKKHNLNREGGYYIEANKLNGIIRPKYNQTIREIEDTSIEAIESTTKESELSFPKTYTTLTTYSQTYTRSVSQILGVKIYEKTVTTGWYSREELSRANNTYYPLNKYLSKRGLNNLKSSSYDNLYVDSSAWNKK